jgi:hypothetical protein
MTQMEIAIMILCAIALMGIAWFLNRAPFTVIGKHHGDTNPHSYPPNTAAGNGESKLDSGGVPNLIYGSGTSDGGCGDGGGGNQ